MAGNLKNLFIFIDESGNFDFSEKGTKHLVLASYSTFKPEENTSEFQKLKYNLLANGKEQECFHATEDLQAVRNEVLDIIKNSKHGKYNFVIVDKTKITQKDKVSKRGIYTYMVAKILHLIFDMYSNIKCSSIVLVIDQSLTKKEQGFLKQTIKLYLKNLEIPYHIYFFSTKSDLNSQIADYGAWSQYVNLERGESRPLEVIKDLVNSQVKLF